MMWGPGMGYGFMGWMPFIGIFFWLLILFLVLMALRAFMSPHQQGMGPWHVYDDRERGDRRSAGLGILEERYARGEINRDEYLQKKQDILGHSTTS